MGSPTRRERIEALLAQEPEDPFLRYSLAMELRKQGEVDRALELFEQLQHLERPYVPAFFMAGQLLVELGRVEEAQVLLRRGIQAARAQGDHHAAEEMSQLLESLS